MHLRLICLALPLALAGCLPSGGGSDDDDDDGAVGQIDGGGGGAGGGGPDSDGGAPDGDLFDRGLFDGDLPDGDPTRDADPASDAGPGDPDADPMLPDRGPFPGTACVRVVPADLDFGSALLDVERRIPLTLESCGAAPLTLTAIELVADSGGRFGLDDLPALPRALPAALPGEPPASLTVTVTFTPDALGAYGGVLRIESDDPVTPFVDVTLSGRGADNACPVPIADADEYDVQPLDIVLLDGVASTDPDGADGRPVRYEWTVVERPDGSVAQPVEAFFNAAAPADGGPPDDPETPAARFFVDVAGVYVIELRVTDELGLTAPGPDCPEPLAEVRITAQPEAGLHIQLTWDTPGDPDPGDAQGTDLDLWLRHPTADGWAAGELRCDYQNVNPDWGAPDDPTDDPSLDIDDINGAGPESINLGRPEDTAPLGGGYAVGVHYYRAESDMPGQPGWGPSVALMRIYIESELAFEAEGELRATGAFWEPAVIEWGPDPDDRRALPVDRFSDMPPP